MAILTLPRCAVCGSNEVHTQWGSADRFCSTGCEDWIIREYRSLVLRDLATNMRGKGIKMRGDQVVMWT